MILNIDRIKNTHSVKNYILINFIFALAYSCFYDFIFYNYIVSLFFEPYHEMTLGTKISYYFLSVFPIVFYKGLKNIAAVFSIYVYIFAYIPFIETLSVGGYGPEFDDYRCVFFLGMCMFFLTDNLTLGKSMFYRKPLISYNKFQKLSLFILLFVVLINARNLHFTNFISADNNLYDLRANLNVVGGTLVLYLIFWLKNVIIPIILICSLINGDKLYSIISFVGFFLIFMIDQQKITFIAPFVIVLFYYLYKKKPAIFGNYYHLLLMSALMLFSFLCYSLHDVSNLAYTIAAILIMRTQCIEGMELNTYFNWFGHSGSHPYTYYSHINVINAITDSYPYNQAIGYVVTNDHGNANGMFWLMDGIAAGGIFGCIFISIIYIIVKSYFNGLYIKCDIRIFAIISTFVMASAMNLSLFTSLFSCGLLVYLLIFIYVDLPQLNNVNK